MGVKRFSSLFISTPFPCSRLSHLMYRKIPFRKWGWKGSAAYSFQPHFPVVMVKTRRGATKSPSGLFSVTVRSETFSRIHSWRTSRQVGHYSHFASWRRRPEWRHWRENTTYWSWWERSGRGGRVLDRVVGGGTWEWHGFENCYLIWCQRGWMSQWFAMCVTKSLWCRVLSEAAGRKDIGLVCHPGRFDLG
jgi:hypothetical protein